MFFKIFMDLKSAPDHAWYLHKMEKSEEIVVLTSFARYGLKFTNEVARRRMFFGRLLFPAAPPPPFLFWPAEYRINLLF